MGYSRSSPSPSTSPKPDPDLAPTTDLNSNPHPNPNPQPNPNQVRDDGAGWAPPALLEAPPSVQYMHAVTWAVGILWGISEPEPETVVQQVVGLGVMLCGVLVSAVVVGTATTIVADMHAQASEVSSRLHRIRRYT